MRKFFNWDTVFLSSITLIVLYLTVVPILVMIFGSLQSGLPGSWTPLTINNYIEAFSTPSLYQAIFNAIIYSLGAGAISFSLGTYLAWLTERTNITFKGLIYSSVLSALMIPGVLFTISWILLLSPRAGLINIYLRQLFGFTSGPFDPFGMLGMILVSGIDDFYTPFLFMAAAFRSMDPSMEEASITSGAGTMTTFYRVTFRLMLPASLAVGLLVFIRGLEDFEVPALLGIPAGVYVLSTEIFLAVRRPPGDLPLKDFLEAECRSGNLGNHRALMPECGAFVQGGLAELSSTLFPTVPLIHSEKATCHNYSTDTITALPIRN